MFRAQRDIPLFLAITLLGTSCSYSQKTEVSRAISSESIAKIKYPWPSNYEVADVDEMNEFIGKELKKEIELKARKTNLGSVAWSGVRRLDYILTQRDILGRFSRASLAFQKEKGQEPIDIIIWSYINIGMDQGIRDFYKGTRVTKIRDNVNALELLLRDSQKQVAEIKTVLEELNSGLLGISDNPELIMEEMRNLPVQETEQANALALREMIEGYYSVSVKVGLQSRKVLEEFFLSNFDVVKEQGIRLQLRDNRTIISLEQRVIEKAYTDLQKNGSLSKNDVEFLKVTLGQLRERLN
ncbi:MAG: hypothetical protein K2Q18_07430 [Bdellovibrionales bacterium]|nr:hypothetical protein [Bdellovibrionales bacterium]